LIVRVEGFLHSTKGGTLANVLRLVPHSRLVAIEYVVTFVLLIDLLRPLGTISEQSRIPIFVLGLYADRRTVGLLRYANSYKKSIGLQRRCDLFENASGPDLQIDPEAALVTPHG
jgi:hypothetical protein